ncbi:YusW-like protein [Gracilibacillus ureilyticus]|uniref:YusW-like protein n=1 Tax=Gracilibacillus ureilyticus TaxID=531814 RepID=A0A1H9VTR5_9BACI|nr:YusW family protein [Gracilibacillus ureilyticus]SES24921.1 YusW-like protein [Gracilibacillus ureilyticus]
MKRGLLSIGSSIIFFLLLVACGDNDEVENPPQNNPDDNQQQAEENNNNTTNDTEANTDTGYPFTTFDLEADFQDTNDTLDVDYENEQDDQMEASYQDKSQDIDLNGDAAMEELDSIFSSFDFDENTSDEEILNTVTQAFNIPEEAQNVELDIQFSNGTEKEYRK